MALTYSKPTIWAARFIEIVVSVILRPVISPATPRPNAEDPIVVLVEPFQLGDVLSLSVMLDPILSKFPKAKIVVWCHTKNAEAFTGDRRVWKTIHAPFSWSNRGSKTGSLKDWKAVLESCRAIRSLKPDVVIDPRGDIRSQVVMLLAGSTCRVGYTTYVHSNIRIRGLLLTQRLREPKDTHRYTRNLNALSYWPGGVPDLALPAMAVPPGDPAQIRVPGIRNVLIHPGAGWLYRRWATPKWSELISRLQELPSVHVTILAGPGELELTTEINRSLKVPADVFFRPYDELLKLVARADVFIGTDSGPMNIAALMNIPVVALFGPGESQVWRPLSDRSRFIHKIENYPCHPCTQKICVRPKDSCMTVIEVPEVFEAVVKVLSGGSQPAAPTLVTEKSLDGN